MRLVFAGHPDFVTVLKSADLPTLRSRVTAFVNVPKRDQASQELQSTMPSRPSLAQLALTDAGETWSGPAAGRQVAPAPRFSDSLHEPRHGAVTVVAWLVASAAVAWLAVVPGAVPRLRAFVAGQSEARPVAASRIGAAEPVAVAELGPRKAIEAEPEDAAGLLMLQGPAPEAIAVGTAFDHPEPAAVSTPEPAAADLAAATIVPPSVAPEAVTPAAADKPGAAAGAARIVEPVTEVKASEPAPAGPLAAEAQVEPMPARDDAVATAAIVRPELSTPTEQSVQPPAAPMPAAVVQPAALAAVVQPAALAAVVQPAAPAAVVQPAAPVAPIPPAMADAMVRRGRTMLEQGNVSAARLLFGRAAEAGYGPAARAMGTTYDAASLEQIGVYGLRPDPKEAVAWYQRALALGDTDARRPLEALSYGGGQSPAQPKASP
jgi:hypothetical protein